MRRFFERKVTELATKLAALDERGSVPCVRNTLVGPRSHAWDPRVLGTRALTRGVATVVTAALAVFARRVRVK